MVGGRSEHVKLPEAEIWTCILSVCKTSADVLFPLSPRGALFCFVFLKAGKLQFMFPLSLVILIRMCNFLLDVKFYIFYLFDHVCCYSNIL